MIVKILDDYGKDKHIISAARFRWNEGGTVLDCFANLDDHEATKIKVSHGDCVFFMNDSGKTVDSKRIVLYDDKRVVHYLGEFTSALRDQLLDDEKRWGDAWLCKSEEQEKYHITRFVQYYLESQENGTALPWLKVAGGALICWIKENHPDILTRVERPRLTVKPVLVSEE